MTVQESLVYSVNIFNRKKVQTPSKKEKTTPKHSENIFPLKKMIVGQTGTTNYTDTEETFANLIKRFTEESTDSDALLILQPSIESNYDFSTSFLPEKFVKKNFTLVLDLDETLVHFKESSQGQGYFLKRPYVYRFLEIMSTYYEIVIFTAATKDYADLILDEIDSGNRISYRLYRDHTSLCQNVHLKDLGKIGRDLTKTIIVDNNKVNFSLHPQNGIAIKSWYGDPADQALQKLTPILIDLALQDPEDIRVALKELKMKIGKIGSPPPNKSKIESKMIR